MPALNGLLEADGALVAVLLGWSEDDVRSQRQALRPVPAPVNLRGLLDTGAEVSCVDAAVVQTLGLPMEGITITNVPAVGGIPYGMQYKASVTLVHPSGSGGDNLVVGNGVVIELPLGQLGYQILVGRDVLALCDFLYSGRGGTFTLTY